MIQIFNGGELWLGLKYIKIKENPLANRAAKRMNYIISCAKQMRKVYNDVVINCTRIKRLNFIKLKHLLPMFGMVGKDAPVAITLDNSPGRPAGRGEQEQIVKTYRDLRTGDRTCVFVWAVGHVDFRAGPAVGRTNTNRGAVYSGTKWADDMGGSYCLGSGSAFGVRIVPTAGNAVLHPDQPP